MDNTWFHNGTKDITKMIWTILEAQHVKAAEDLVGETIQACADYYARMIIETKGNPAVQDIEKFLSLLKRLNRSKLSYEAKLEIGYQVERLEEIEKEIVRSFDKIRRGKGRPETWARDVFINDLAKIFYKLTGEKPGLPYRVYSKESPKKKTPSYNGPFFRLVKALLGIVKNSPHLSDAAITTSIRKIVDPARPSHKG